MVNMDGNTRLSSFAKPLQKIGGRASVINFYGQLLPIAQQCPDQGGPSVFRARHFVAMVNDSIEYDDAGVCLSQGILRTANTNNSQQPCLILLPNPASSETELVLTNYSSEFFSIKISSSDGKIIEEKQIKNGNSRSRINTSQFPPGIFIVEAFNNGASICRTKLIIVK
jgi:Secretion system C-terminal sorting domain